MERLEELKSNVEELCSLLVHSNLLSRREIPEPENEEEEASAETKEPVSSRQDPEKKDLAVSEKSSGRWADDHEEDEEVQGFWRAIDERNPFIKERKMEFQNLKLGQEAKSLKQRPKKSLQKRPETSRQGEPKKVLVKS